MLSVCGWEGAGAGAGAGAGVQDKQFKTDLQDDSHLGFQIEKKELFLIYQSPQYFLSSFELIGLSVLEKLLQIHF